MPKVSFLIAAHNEAATIRDVLEQVEALGVAKQVIVVDDGETGYKAFRADVLRSLDLRQDDFGIEPELTGEVCRRKLRIYELPVAYYGRTYAEGKKITWRDGLKAVWVLFEVRLRGSPQ